MSQIRERSVVRSAVTASTKYCSAGWLLRLWNGSTTIERGGGERTPHGGIEVQLKKASIRRAAKEMPPITVPKIVRRNRPRLRDGIISGPGRICSGTAECWVASAL